MVRHHLLILLFTSPLYSAAQTAPPPPQDTSTYGLRVAVDEVILTFHAADSHGMPINDLKLNELTVLDDGKTQSLQDVPLHAGILVDTSDSTRKGLPENRAIAIQYAQSFLNRSRDLAFVMGFSKLWNIEPAWTNDPSALIQGIQHVATSSENRVAGTAIYDNLAHNSGRSNTPPAETSSCSFQMAKTMPAINPSKMPSMRANMQTPPSMPFVRMRIATPPAQPRWRSWHVRQVDGSSAAMKSQPICS